MEEALATAPKTPEDLEPPQPLSSESLFPFMNENPTKSVASNNPTSAKIATTQSLLLNTNNKPVHQNHGGGGGGSGLVVGLSQRLDRANSAATEEILNNLEAIV